MRKLAPYPFRVAFQFLLLSILLTAGGPISAGDLSCAETVAGVAKFKLSELAHIGAEVPVTQVQVGDEIVAHPLQGGSAVVWGVVTGLITFEGHQVLILRENQTDLPGRIHMIRVAQMDQRIRRLDKALPSDLRARLSADILLTPAFTIDSRQIESELGAVSLADAPSIDRETKRRVEMALGQSFSVAGIGGVVASLVLWDLLIPVRQWGFRPYLLEHQSNFTWTMSLTAILLGYVHRKYPGQKIYYSVPIAFGLAVNTIEEVQFFGHRLSPNDHAGHGTDWADFSAGMFGMAATFILYRHFERKFLAPSGRGR